MKPGSLLRSIYRAIIIARKSVDQRVFNKGRFILTSLLHTAFLVSEVIIPITAVAAFAIVINDIGFHPFHSHHHPSHQGIIISLFILKIFMIVRFISEWNESRKFSTHVYSFALLILTFYLYHLVKEVDTMPASRQLDFQWRKVTLYTGIIFLFLTEVSTVLRFIYRKSLNTSFLFIISFAFIILGVASC